MSNACSPVLSAVAESMHAEVTLAQRYLGLALYCDYLSSGQGHQQSRRLIGERMAGRRLKSALHIGANDDVLADAGRDVAGSKAGSAAPRRKTARAPRAPLDAEQRYLWEIARTPRLTSAEEYGLAVRMRAGDRAARDALLEANLGLVVMFARRYQRPGVQMLDLIAEGNLGLLSASRRFDPELGHRFATYAKWWVRRAIQLALPGLVGVVRLPSTHYAAQRAAQRSGEAPVDELPPLAEGGGETDGQLLHDGAGAAPGRAAADEPALEAVRYRAFGAELPDAQVLGALAIPTEQEPPGATMALQRMSVLRRALDTLGERDRVVVSERYALFNDRVCTLDELAKRFGVSIERIRQIENAAVKKLGKALSGAGASADTLL